MSKKGENIFKRKDGRWEARYIKGYELSGKIKYGFCYGKTYREAKEKSMQCKAALLVKMPLPVTSRRRHRFSFFCEEWLHLKKEKVKESTYVKYSTILTLHILPKLGACFPLGLSTSLVEQFRQELFRDGLSATSVRDTLIVLRAILKYTSAQFPGTFPAVEIQYPKESKKEVRVLSIEEQQYFVSCLRKEIDVCKFGILLALLTGLRIGELCALRWENISLNSKTIRVEATMQRLQNIDGTSESKTRIIISAPKSDSSIRTIPIPDSIVGLCRQFDPHCLSAFILTGTQDYMEPRKLQRYLKRLTKEYGLKDVHFHTLRHSFATRCMEVGFEIKSLSEILGHANTSITLNRYVHASMEVKRNNMNLLASAGF